MEGLGHAKYLLASGVNVRYFPRHIYFPPSSLSHRDLVKEQPNILSSEHALDREGGTWKEIQAAKQEHAAFAMSTYCALVHHDVEAFGFSSLSTICRLDIGIMMNPATQMFDYFVNGVERGCAMSWSSGSFFPGDTLHAQAIADELLPHMLELIDNHSE